MSHKEDTINEDKTVVATDTLKRSLSNQDAPPVLVVLMGPPTFVGKQFPLVSAECILGRSSEASISIDDRSLSRSHAKFSVNGSEVSVVDLGSTNKTVVNNVPLVPMATCYLKNNDQIKVGNIILKYLEKGSLEALSNQALHEKANKDALTGIYSKGFLIEKAPEAVKRAETLKEDLSIIVFDIDHFKKINDSFGHPGGDYVLKELCRIIRSNMIRSNDLFSRFGGEEFVIILTGTPLQIAQDIAERIRNTIESSSFTYEDRKIPVTISLGVSVYHEGELDWNVLFNRADKALYQSKQGGRNKVTVAT